MRAFLKLFLITVILVSVLLSVTLIFGAICLLKYKDSRVDEALLTVGAETRSTTFYRYDFSDREKRLGNAIPIEDAYLDNGIKYKYFSLNEMPEHLINAFIAIEDKRFYTHHGIDWKRTFGATVNFVLGKKRFGGSTITQQLVKNLTGNGEISISRKLSEAFSAKDLENRCDKSEIIETYLNIINLSEGCRGVGAAAEFFYSKSPRELTLSECATIAAITNNPSYYNPKRHPENNLKRRNTVLYCMLEQNMISENEYNIAIAEPITLKIKQDSSYSSNSWYIDMVIEDVINDFSEKYNISKSYASLMLYHGGYKIYTAMDCEIQNILEEYYANVYNFPIDENGEQAQSSMIVIDPYNGDILGVAGAVGEKKGSRVQNYATDTRRPPASSIKPLSVYAPALDRGLINWASIIEDSPIKQNGDSPWPKNVDERYRGNVNVNYAIDHSLNTVAVKVLRMVGADESMNFLKNKLRLSGYDEKKDRGEAALALGQPSVGVTLKELVAAYSIFEEGIMSKTRSYYRVTDASGTIILNNAPEYEVVISRDTAAIMTKLLESVVDNGTAAGKITLDDKISVAGKSGTSQNNCDRYFVGYTPELLGGVWFGYDYPKDLESFGGNLSVLIWDDIMCKIYSDTKWGRRKSFSIPDTVQQITYGYSSDNEAQNGWFSIEPHNKE